MFVSISAAAQPQNEYLTVLLVPGQTIRQVAEEHLGDPDLWPDILRASDVTSVAALRPGMELRVPVGAVSSANRALGEALSLIQEANEAGAQIFAPDEIGRAVAQYEGAQAKRLAHDWPATRELAGAAAAEAASALETAQAARDQSGEALVSDRSGDVEGQRPEDLAWRDLQLRAILIEEEKVRTLSNSTAQITFRDASRLRLNPNSNAVIEVMRFDPLASREEAKVSLVEGDFYALLAGGRRDSFNVEVSQVSASIDSENFWVSKGGESAKFANYDDGVVNVAANGEAVTLGRNQGTVVAEGEAPSEAVALLPAPELSAPEDQASIHVNTPELIWAKTENAAGYWLEIAADRNFNAIVGSEFGLIEPRHVTGALTPGDYFWRVSALDGFGLPGPKSAVRRFQVQPDETPPYLTIETPAAKTILREAAVTVTGRSEPDAKVTVNGEPVETKPDGGYSLHIAAEAGANSITVVAVDAAGNRTERQRRFTFMPDRQSIVAFDPALTQVAPNHFLTNATLLSLAGRTTPNSAVRIGDDTGVVAEATTDAQGAFRVNVPVPAPEQRFTLAVIASSGFVSEEEIAVSVDREPPEIALDKILPRLTSEASLRISGRTEPGAELTLNGQPIVLRDGRFDETVTLNTGTNRVELIATDKAGNVRVETSSVALDQAPPVLISAEALPAAGGQPLLSLTITANDNSGLARAAAFAVTAGATEHTGYLRYNRASRSYEGTVALPQAELAKAKLAQIELSDDAGNSRTFDLK